MHIWNFKDYFIVEVPMDPVQYNELTRFLRDHKLPFEKQNGKQKKKFLTMAQHFVWERNELQQKTVKQKVKVIQNLQEINFQKIICEHGCPEVLQNDRRIHFVNRIIEDLMKRFRIKHCLSLPYHSQTNGLVKKFNQTLCEKLAKLSEETDQWDEFVDPILIAYRMTKHSATGITPFLLTYGREAVLPIDETKLLTIHERMMSIVEEIPHIREEVRLIIQKA